MGRLCALLVVLVMMCWPAVCQAGVDDTGHYMILGEGTQSCGAWTKGRANRDDVARFIDGAWVSGYITVVNRFGYGPSDLSEGIDNAGIEAWIDNYCAQHPLENIANAASALVDELQVRAPQNQNQDRDSRASPR